MPVCRHCGGLNRAEATQCEKCGASLAPEAESAETPAPSHLTQHDAELAALLRDGRKIDAIKFHREVTGMGLKEAKDYVEALAVEQGIPQAKGCGVAAVVLAGTLLGMFALATLQWLA